ncbi:MAG: PQQ-binding-like beta-propeller repeat protein [Parvularculaceae bacterium]
MNAPLKSGLASLVAAVVLSCAPSQERKADSAGATTKTAHPALEGDAARYNDAFGGRSSEHPGAALFETHCAQCHAGQVARAPHRDLMQLMSPTSILASLTDGAMKGQASAISNQEKEGIAEYLSGKSLEAGEAPEPRWCALENRGFDFAARPAWTSWGVDGENSHAIPASVAGIKASDVTKLRLKWAFAFPDATRVRSQPVFAGGSLFIGSHDGTVYALDRKSACVKWKFKAASEVRTGIIISDWDVSDKTAQATLYFGDFLGDVYAVDAATGELRWRVSADDHPSATLTGAPALFEGKLFVPVSSLEVLSASDPLFSCCTFRGSVLALDAGTGEILWRTYTVAEEAAETAKNAVGVMQRGPSGAPVWSTPAIDPKRRALYFGTGENYSSPATATSDAIFSLSLDDGAVRWIYQATSNDAFNTSCLVPDRINCPKEDGPDLDFGAAVIFADRGSAGDLVLAGQKSGDAYALDADTGKLHWKKRVGRGGVVGGIHFGIAAEGGRLYVPIADTPDGRTYIQAPRPGMYALDIGTGDEVWAAPMADRCGGKAACFPGFSAAISAVGDLVMAGGIDGILRFYVAETGEEIWSFDTARTFETTSGAAGNGGGMSGGFAPVAYDGVIYVGSGYAFAGPAPGNVLLAFEASE